MSYDKTNDTTMKTEEGRPIASARSIERAIRLHTGYQDGDGYQFSVGDEVYVDFIPVIGNPNKHIKHDGFKGTIVAGKEVVIGENDDGEDIIRHEFIISPDSEEEINTTVRLKTSDEGEFTAPVYSNSNIYQFPHEVFGVNGSLYTPRSAVDMLVDRQESAYEAKMDKQRSRRREHPQRY